MKFRLLFNPANDAKAAQMIDSEAPTPESMNLRAQCLLDMLDRDYSTCTIFAEKASGKWEPIAIKCRFLS